RPADGPARRERPRRGFGGDPHGGRRRDRREDGADRRTGPRARVLRRAHRGVVVAAVMTGDQFLWTLARVTALSAYGSLAVAVLTGIALRTGVLDWLGSNRALRSLHEYATVLWLPLAVLHVTGLVLDSTARVGFLDVFVPFRAPYGTL